MQVLKELESLLEGAKIAILDKDHTSTQKKLHNILNDFNAQKTNILIGTQMISKGHDYAKVSLAVVLGIDNIIKSNSYRALEEGVSLLYQIAGRSARQISGQVFIQSTETDLLENFLEDYEDFYNTNCKKGANSTRLFLGCVCWSLSIKTKKKPNN